MKTKLTLNELLVKSFNTEKSPKIKGGRTYNSCAVSYCPEMCWAGETAEGQPGCGVTVDINAC